MVDNKVSRVVQLCPVDNRGWWRVSVLGFPDSAITPETLEELTYRERIVAWALQENGDVTAVVGVGLYYSDFADHIEVENGAQREQIIGYFTSDDLCDESVRAKIKDAALGLISEQRDHNL